MVHDGPLAEALCIAQVAQVVAVAEHLVCDLRVPHRRAVHVIIHCTAVLDQLLRQRSDVVQHLHQAVVKLNTLGWSYSSESSYLQYMETRHARAELCELAKLIFRSGQSCLVQVQALNLHRAKFI